MHYELKLTLVIYEQIEITVIKLLYQKGRKFNKLWNAKVFFRLNHDLKINEYPNSYCNSESMLCCY